MKVDVFACNYTASYGKERMPSLQLEGDHFFSDSFMFELYWHLDFLVKSLQLKIIFSCLLDPKSLELLIRTCIFSFT